MNAAKVYKKTKVEQTPLALVQIESEYYEERPVVVLAEGPPKWLKKTDPSQPHPDAKRQTDQRHHMNVLFQLGLQHQSDSGEEKSAGSSVSSCDNRESVGAHRAASARHLVVSDDFNSSDLLSNNNKEAPPPPQREVVEKNAAETYLGISLRDISNKLFMTSMDTKKKDRSGGVEETKEGDERDSMPSMAGFDIGKVLPMNLLDSIPTMPFISGVKTTSDEAELNDPAANGAAPLFTEEMWAKQQQSLVPLTEIRIMNPCDVCNANLLTVDDSGCYLRPSQSDDMSCVTIDNMNPAS